MPKKSFVYFEIFIIVTLFIFLSFIFVSQTKILTRLSELDKRTKNNLLLPSYSRDASENPKEVRDLKRITDLKKLKKIIEDYLKDPDIIKPNLDNNLFKNLCKDHLWYSIPKSFHNGCPKGKICVYPESIKQASQVNGKGWIPINFTLISKGSPIPALPLDPINSPPFYYVYSCNEKNSTFEIDTKLESKFYKYSLDEDGLDDGDAPNLFEVGNVSGLTLLNKSESSFFVLNSSRFWQARSSMPVARSGLTASTIDGKIYVIGGYNGDSLGYLSINEEYNSQNNNWQEKAPMPTPRSLLRSVSLNGKIYVIGGYNSKNKEIAKNEAYDPKTNSWQEKAPMPTPRDGLGLVAVNGKIYAIGGWDGSKYLSTNEAYDPKTNSWQEKAPMPTPRDGLGLVAVNGKIYAIGGINKKGYLSTNEAYDPKTNSWQEKAPMPTPRNNLVIKALNGKIYAIGGWNVANLNTNEVYDPKTNSWQTSVNMPTPRVFLSGAVVNNKIYLLGGYNGTSDLITNEVFDPRGEE